MMYVNFIAIVFWYLEVWATRLRCQVFSAYLITMLIILWFLYTATVIVIRQAASYYWHERWKTPHRDQMHYWEKDLHKPLVMVWAEYMLSQDICLWDNWAVLLMAQSPLSLWEETGCPWQCLLTPLYQQVSLQASQDISAFGWVKVRQEEFRVVSTRGEIFFKSFFSQSTIITGQCWCKKLLLEVHFLILQVSDSFKVGNELFMTHWRGGFLCRKIMVNGNQQKLYTHQRNKVIFSTQCCFIVWSFLSLVF